MSKQNNIFFTSDLHINHGKSIEFDNRPFRDLNHMHKVLLNNYNNTVKDKDICYFLGDVGNGKGDVLKNFVNKLNGIKILILGNHDKGRNAMLQLGFDVVMNGAMLYIAEHKVTLTHCPLIGTFREDITGMRGAKEGDNWHGEHKNKFKYSIANEGQFHLHGHVHSKSKDKILLKQFDIGVCGNNYTPVNISVIESWISKYGKI